MKNRTTGYSDFYKGTSSKPPGQKNDDDNDDAEYGIPKAPSLTKNVKKLTPLQEARKRALKRRLNKKVG